MLSALALVDLAVLEETTLVQGRLAALAVGKASAASAAQLPLLALRTSAVCSPLAKGRSHFATGRSVPGAAAARLSRRSWLVPASVDPKHEAAH